MNIIVGASGQVGTYLIQELKQIGLPVRAIARDPQKISDKTIETKVADLFHLEELIEAFRGGTTAFVITPENPLSNDLFGDTEQIVANYRRAIEETGIKRVIALSCVGAHISENTGNILLSRILEQGLDPLHIEKIFIRPSYYYSNWLFYMESMEQTGVLPSFYPKDFAIEMHSPIDLAWFIASTMRHKEKSPGKTIYELSGELYRPLDIAKVFSKRLQKKIEVQTIPPQAWIETLLSAGFTQNTAASFAEMTQAVLDKRVGFEFPNNTTLLYSLFDEYLEELDMLGG
jgi:uncharacterized protein YbjT (DUF2867 family)